MAIGDDGNGRVLKLIVGFSGCQTGLYTSYEMIRLMLEQACQVKSGMEEQILLKTTATLDPRAMGTWQ